LKSSANPKLLRPTACLRALWRGTPHSARPIGIFVCGCALVFALSGCRLDMHLQPRYNPEGPSTFFTDGRSVRDPVPGTVARGQLRIDDHLYTGQVDGKDATDFPFPIKAADMARGQQRYNIYCSPCHDYLGAGNGMIVQRGFPQPPSFQSDRLRAAAPGHFFAVMTNGYGAMYSYASRITPEDRWRIAAYIRALQMSQQAQVADLPADEKAKLQESKP
jgi:mono/diheme cytochrome c family protein